MAVDQRVSQRREELFDRLLAILPPGRLVDLGAGHGFFSLRAADRGWKVTAVDARTDRMPKDPRVRWVHGDIREVRFEDFDVVACLGLFYHLTAGDQIDLLTACRGLPMIIDTHLANGKSTFELSEPVVQRGYEGRLFRETLSSLLASWGNEDSFWPTPEAFTRMLADHGYPVVLAAEPWYLPDRTFFLALPRGYAPEFTLRKALVPHAQQARTVLEAASRKARQAASRLPKGSSAQKK